MASHLVSQHQLASYASPDNGQAGDATVVLGNDNTTVTGYNSHDSDATIHVQDSSAAVFAATPAGTQGRKWITNDTGAIYLYYDNGSAWVEVNYLRNTGGTVTGNIAITGTLTVTSAAASAFAVGRQGATDPVLKVVASTASVATGISLTGAAAGGGMAVAVISSGANEALTIDAKGSGTITLGGTSTGAITLGRSTTFTSGVTVTLTGTTIAGAPTWSSSQAITLSTAAQPNITSLGTLTALTVSAGSNASSALAVGSGGGSPTAGRTASLALNAPSDGTFPGAAIFVVARASTDVWEHGIDSTGASGIKTTNTDYYWFAASNYNMVLTTGGNLSTRGGLTSLGKIQTTLTTEQLRLRYDATNYMTITVAADGTTTFDSVDDGSTGAFVFSDPVTAFLVAPTGVQSRASIEFGAGSSPVGPTEGSFWYDGTNLKFHDGAAERTISWT